MPLMCSEGADQRLGDGGGRIQPGIAISVEVTSVFGHSDIRDVIQVERALSATAESTRAYIVLIVWIHVESYNPHNSNCAVRRSSQAVYSKNGFL